MNTANSDSTYYALTTGLDYLSVIRFILIYIGSIELCPLCSLSGIGILTFRRLRQLGPLCFYLRRPACPIPPCLPCLQPARDIIQDQDQCIAPLPYADRQETN